MHPDIRVGDFLFLVMIKYFFRLILIISCIIWCCGFISAFAGQRIISLAPDTTEILFALGLDNEIVAVTTFCDYPPQALSKIKIGTFSNPDIEKIISLKPDIIFATGLEQDRVVAKLKKLKLNVYVSYPSSIEELLISIKRIGELTFTQDKAKALIVQMRDRIEKVKAQTRSRPLDTRPKVFIEIWDVPLITAGKGSFIDELIYTAGGINIAHDTPRPYSYFSPEAVIARDPDCIIVGYMNDKNKEQIGDRLGFGGIKAVKTGSVYYDINPDTFLRAGPRLVEGLEEIHKRLYR